MESIVYNGGYTHTLNLTDKYFIKPQEAHIESECMKLSLYASQQWIYNNQ